jgi:hypothetical protein
MPVAIAMVLSSAFPPVPLALASPRFLRVLCACVPCALRLSLSRSSLSSLWCSAQVLNELSPKLHVLVCFHTYAKLTLAVPSQNHEAAQAHPLPQWPRRMAAMRSSCGTRRCSATSRTRSSPRSRAPSTRRRVGVVVAQPRPCSLRPVPFVSRALCSRVRLWILRMLVWFGSGWFGALRCRQMFPPDERIFDEGDEVRAATHPDTAVHGRFICFIHAHTPTPRTLSHTHTHMRIRPIVHGVFSATDFPVYECTLSVPLTPILAKPAGTRHHPAWHPTRHGAALVGSGWRVAFHRRCSSATHCFDVSAHGVLRRLIRPRRDRAQGTPGAVVHRVHTTAVLRLSNIGGRALQCATRKFGYFACVRV